MSVDKPQHVSSKLVVRARTPISLTADGDEEQRHAVDSQQVVACAARLAAARRIAAGDRCDGVISPADADRSTLAPCDNTSR